VRTRGKLNIRALPFFYLTIASLKFFKHFEGFYRPSKNCLFKPLGKRQKMRSFTGLKRTLVCPIWKQSKYCANVCRFYYNNMVKKFWAIKVHKGKMQKFATVSSQICIMQYVQRTLLLGTLVCFCSICGPCFVGSHTKIESIHVVITTSFHYFTHGT